MHRTIKLPLRTRWSHGPTIDIGDCNRQTDRQTNASESVAIMQCFFNLFFETEPFAAILIAHRTHGLSQKFCLGGNRKNSRLRAGKRFLIREQLARGSGWRRAISSLSGVQHSPDRRCILDTLGVQKTHLVATNVVSSRFSIWFGGTLGYHWFCRTPVEKH